MPTSFRPCAPDQSLLFPPSPRDWLPEGHLAFFIADTVAVLDLSALYAPYDGDGRRNQPFDPQMMLPVLVYAYATGTFSSRKIARQLHEKEKTITLDTLFPPPEKRAIPATLPRRAA